MKNKFLLAAMSLILIATTAFAFAFKAPITANVASAGSLANIRYKVYLENVNNILNGAKPIIANKQVGIYFEEYPANCSILLVGSDGSQIQKSIVNNRVEIPIKNNVTTTIRIKLNSPILPTLELGVSITYDTEKPTISAKTQRAKVSNNETVIGKPVVIRANDNFGNVKLYLSKNDSADKLCSGSTYTITKNGKYTFYTVDIAGNYSDDFTVKFFENESDKEQSKPTTPDESDPTVSEDESTAVKPIIVIALVIAVVIIGIVIFVIVYKRAKAKAVATQFDDEE